MRIRPTLIYLAAITFPILLAAQEPSNRDRFKEDLAGNEEVERIIRTFAGKGEVGDDSDPTPAAEAIKLFRLPEDLKIELVANEPEVMQPLFMHFDDHGRLWVMEYLQYPFPEGLKVIRYDQYLRAVFDKVPSAPPNHVKGKDQIRVFSDTNGDGTYDTSHVAIDGLNIASSIATGYGGIFVLNPPYLLFYPDADGDAHPDGDPEVRLSGFGLEDTHSVANSLIWGPDGWLYGANGSTSTGNVSSGKTKNVQWEGQNIWRYHPVLDLFEIYAEGGGNTFSSEIDSRGRVFSGTNHGNTRGMYYPQGSFGSKNWGKHGPLTNPYAFGFFLHMKHEGDKDRFPQTFVIYEGGTLPDRYNGNVIAANSLHNRVWASDVSRDGSSYRTVDMPPVAETEDRWFRPVDVKVGPDGAVYLADWYDTRLSHVDPRDNWHKTSGRVYRIQSKDHSPTSLNVDLPARSDRELMTLFAHKNKWWRQTAVRVLGERLRVGKSEDAESTLKALNFMVRNGEAEALEALWTLHWAGKFDEQLAAELLQIDDRNLRRWTWRLLGDHRNLTDEFAATLPPIVEKEPYVQVRSQIASAAKRFRTEHALPIISALWTHSEDANDPHMPLMTWWALEAHCGLGEADSTHIAVPLNDSSYDVSPQQQVVKMFEDASLWDLVLVEGTIIPRVMRRFAMEPDNAGLKACEQLLAHAPSQEHRKLLISGFMEAYAGREIEKLPDGLRKAIDEYRKSAGGSELALGVRLGDADGINKALAAIRSGSTDLPTKLELIRTFGEVDQPSCVGTLLGLLTSSSSALKKAAMESLMSYSDDKIASTICGRYHSSIPDEHGLRETAHRVLASRPSWAKRLLEEVEAFRIKPRTISLDVVNQMRLHDDEELNKLLDKHWGKTRATPEEKLAEMQRLQKLIKASAKADLTRGHELFKKNCGVCHTLFDEGGQTGPNLTGYERTNVDFLTLAIADPSAAIREEFTQFQIATNDGRVLTGLLENQTPTTVTLRGANNQVTVINRDDVEILKAMPTSIMPDDLTKKLSDQELKDLMGYVMSPTGDQ